jgi:hypothetical protein
MKARIFSARPCQVNCSTSFQHRAGPVNNVVHIGVGGFESEALLKSRLTGP